jgi:7-carboxy-7-deazaguanine synthase
MPEGRTPQAVRRHLRAVAGAAIDSGFNVSGRLHVDIWDDERGH